MEQAWQERNYGELANLAHWLKGSGGTVGFDAFTNSSTRPKKYERSHGTPWN